MTFPTPSIVTSRRVVPNQFPVRDDVSYRIALVGEAPGENEDAYGIPFVGVSGNFLNNTLISVGLDRNACFCGNVCQVRPPANNIELFDWYGPEIQDGIAQLRSDLAVFQPNIIVLMGATPLHAFKGEIASILAWRGSLFMGNTGVKCLPTIHPAFVLREFSYNPLLRFDLTRAKDEANSPTLTLPQRELLTQLDASTLCYLMDTWPSGLRCALDIEGGLGGWPCVSLCARPTKSLTIAWGRLSELDHARVLRSFARLMARVDVPKVLQNSLYDNFVLSYGYGIPIRNVVEDTMLKGWEIYCELPKGLKTQASIWTREPYWKNDDMYHGTGEGLFTGCARDSAVTLEIDQAQDGALTAAGRAHYDFNVRMLNPLLYMEVKGINYDKESAATKKASVQVEINQVAERLTTTAGADLRGKKGSLSSTKLASCLYQITNSFSGTGKRRTQDAWTSSAYPPQYKKEQGRKTEKLTTDVEAILNLAKRQPDDKFLRDILRHRHLEGLLETLSIATDPDGRVRCGYNVVGTETGRLSCYTSPTGSGANLTTITKQLRGNFVADPGYDFCQCDLEGADGWTVAAHCHRLGDPTMWDDYRAGMKPAKIIALLYYFGPVINELERSDVKWLHDRVFPIVLREVGKWLYLGCKRVQHGSNYLMGIPTMLLNILKDSFKESGVPVYMEHATARTLQNLYFSRYPGVRTWHQWCESSLIAKGELTSASGHTRIFFGRRFGKDIHDTVKEFLADEPQQNTTYATNLAMLRLWDDPGNRIREVSHGPETLCTTCSGESHILTSVGARELQAGGLLIQPLHQVHDALCVQWPTALRSWARERMRSYFNNELTIAGMKVTIPFDGGFGPSWGECEEKI